MRVTEHLYVYLWSDPQENNGNTIFIDGKVPVLIDPGHLRRTDSLFDRMRADGVDPQHVKLVLATHAHLDHIEGFAAFKNGTVKLVMSREEERFAEQTLKPAYQSRGLKIPNYTADFFLAEGDLILGKHEFQVLVVPGHTPGGLCIYWPRFKVLISGDMVFLQSVGRSDLPGGDPIALKRSIERLAGLSIELLIPGHGPAIQGIERVKANFQSIGRLLAVG